ncbi:hypothetical protein KL938_004400 [Ogataea parapolymorpha]|nr:hypothetical protein KL938_004400 [Ogataea parapolymorpha]
MNKVLAFCKGSHDGEGTTYIPLKDSEYSNDYTEHLFSAKHHDWRDDFVRNGYVVIKNAIPRHRALKYQKEVFQLVNAFANVDFDEPASWTTETLPSVLGKIYSGHGLNHEKVFWEARLEQGVIDAFAHLWGTNQLLVSYDGFNLTLPVERTIQPWPHFDQSPYKQGLHCAQGIICLSDHSPSDGGLVVYRGSHLSFEEFFKTVPDWEKNDYVELTSSQLAWFTERGCEEVKISCEAGDLIIWDSRTCHWGKPPTEKSEHVRTVLYASYAPAQFASAEFLEIRSRLFYAGEGTTHWTHNNLASYSAHIPELAHRNRPRSPPELSDRLLQLAGTESY